MNKNLVLLLAAIFLTGAVGVEIPAMAVSGPFGYDLQKDIHRTEIKNRENKNKAPEAKETSSANTSAPVSVPVTEEQIFDSNVHFNKVYYPNATIKSAVSKYKNANYTGCLQELYTIIKKNPKDAAAYYYVAMAYTKVGATENAKAAYQKVINLNTNEVLVDYASKGLDCLNGGVACVAKEVAEDANIDPKDPAAKAASELDKFIAAPYGNGMSPEMTEKYKQQQLNAIQNKINNGKTLSPEDVQRLKELQNKSEVITGNLIAFADSKKKPSNEEVLSAIDVLKRAGVNISAETSVSDNVYNQENVAKSEPAQMTYTPDPQIQQMSMMLNGNNSGYNDPMMTMLPYMMNENGKNMDPRLIQAIMTNSMMNSLNGMNNMNNNN